MCVSNEVLAINWRIIQWKTESYRVTWGERTVPRWPPLQLDISANGYFHRNVRPTVLWHTFPAPAHSRLTFLFTVTDLTTKNKRYLCVFQVNSGRSLNGFPQRHKQHRVSFWISDSKTCFRLQLHFGRKNCTSYLRLFDTASGWAKSGLNKGLTKSKGENILLSFLQLQPGLNQD